MQWLERLGTGARTGLMAGLIVFILVTAILSGYSRWDRRHEVDKGVETARSLAHMAEAAQEQTAQKWRNGLLTPQRLRTWAQSADNGGEGILQAAPVVNALRTVRTKLDDASVSIGVVRPGKAEEGGAGARALSRFRESPGMEEVHMVDARAGGVRYFRPIRMEASCEGCHGTAGQRADLPPAGLPSEDLTGYAPGEVMGAFQVVRPLEAMQAGTVSRVSRAAALAFLATILTGTLLAWRLNRRVDIPVRNVVARLGGMIPGGDGAVATDGRRAEGDIADLRGGMDQLVDHISGTLDQWRSQSDQLAANSEELFASADKIGTNSHNTATRIAEMSHSTGEVNQVVREVASNISQVSETASHTSATTDEGRQAMEGAMERMSELKRSTGRVDEMMSTINQIAKQTDLLALNAAIEAANAGEEGKGFAVVAGEVRKLAEQTANTTSEVSNIVEDLRQSTERSVEAMQGVQGQWDEVNSQAKETEGSATQIASAAEELASTMDEHTEHLDEVSGNVEGVSSHVAEVESIAQRVGKLAFELQDGFSHFALEGGADAEGGESLNFREAKIDHYAWKTALRKLLRGDKAMSTDEATSHENCALGKWIYGEGMKKYGSYPEMQTLEKEHKALHQTIHQVIDKANAEGNEAALETFQTFESYSEEVVADLDALAKKIES